MSVDARLDLLPKFQIRAISAESETTLVTGMFNRPECVAVDECGWTGDVSGTPLQGCPKCSSKLKEVEIFGNQEAAFPLDADARFVEIRTGLLDHDHCLICDLAIGREASWGYRESSFAGGPNSVGIWLCEQCFDRYVKRGGFSFLVRSSTAA